MAHNFGITLSFVHYKIPIMYINLLCTLLIQIIKEAPIKMTSKNQCTSATQKIGTMAEICGRDIPTAY